MDLNTADFEVILRSGAGRLLFRGEEGCVLAEEDGTVMSDILDGRTLCDRLRALGFSKLDLAVVKSEDARQMLEHEFGLNAKNPCTQWVYCRPEPPEYPVCDIRPLTMEFAQTVGEQYHNETDYVRERIAAGCMWGVFEDGKLAGFIGTHTEGAMGLLEIFPAYRRRGYGYAMGAFLIGRQLKEGMIPYCHVIDGNDASLHLQKKLGMQKAELPAIWCWAEESET